MDKGFFAFICSCGSLVALVFVYLGLLGENKVMTSLGQVVGYLTLILCVLFWLLYL